MPGPLYADDLHEIKRNYTLYLRSGIGDDRVEGIVFRKVKICKQATAKN